MKESIYNDIAEIKARIEKTGTNETIAELMALEAIANGVARRYDELIKDYDHKADERAKAVYAAAQEMQRNICQDLGQEICSYLLEPQPDKDKAQQKSGSRKGKKSKAESVEAAGPAQPAAEPQYIPSNMNIFRDDMEEAGPVREAGVYESAMNASRDPQK